MLSARLVLSLATRVAYAGLASSSSPVDPEEREAGRRVREQLMAVPSARGRQPDLIVQAPQTKLAAG